MGATLVAQAIQHWSEHVSDRAFRVLVTMAVTAKDNASKDIPAGCYFGGQEALTVALKRDRDGTTDSAIRTVKRAIKELSDVGAIRCTQPAVLGGNAVYLLTLNNTPSIQERDSQGSTYFANGRDTPSPPGGDIPSPPWGDTPSPDRGTTGVPPSKEPLEEPLEELKEEEGVSVRTAVTETRDPAAAETPKDDSSACRDPTCELGFIYDPTMPKGHRNIPCPICRPAKPSNVIPFQRKAAT